MKYLLDTNVLSELQKPQGSEKVQSFIASIPLENLYISVITMGEISYGIERLPASRKKHELLIYFYAKIPEWFKNRIIPIENELAQEWGKMRARAQRTLPGLDSQIATTAIFHNMILVTRNIHNFEDIEGIQLLNPWE